MFSHLNIKKFFLLFLCSSYCLLLLFTTQVNRAHSSALCLIWSKYCKILIFYNQYSHKLRWMKFCIQQASLLFFHIWNSNTSILKLKYLGVYLLTQTLNSPFQTERNSYLRCHNIYLVQLTTVTSSPCTDTSGLRK